MPAQLFRVIVPVSDIEQAARFYESVLQVSGRRVSPGRHYFDCGGTILACYDPRADGDDSESRPNPDHLYISVDDVEATQQLAVAAGATPMDDDIAGQPAGEIATRPWGERSFYVHDPFGNKLCFVDRTTMFTG